MGQLFDSQRVIEIADIQFFCDGPEEGLFFDGTIDLAQKPTIGEIIIGLFPGRFSRSFGFSSPYMPNRNKTGQVTLDFLYAALRSSSEASREFSARMLGVFGREESIPLLTNILMDADPWVCLVALDSIHILGGKVAVDILQQVTLRKDYVCGRTWDFSLLYELWDQKMCDLAVPFLRSVVSSGNRYSKMAATKLMEFGDDSCVPLLFDVIRSGNPYGQEIAEWLLEYKNGAYVPEISAAVIGWLFGGDVFTKQAIELLVRIDGPDWNAYSRLGIHFPKLALPHFMPSLVKICQDEDREFEHRLQAACAVAVNGNTSPLCELITGLPVHGNHVSAELLDAIGVFRVREGIPLLHAAITEMNDYIEPLPKLAAIRSAGLMKESSLVPALAKCLYDQSEDPWKYTHEDQILTFRTRREEAATALGLIGTEEAGAALLDAFLHSGFDIREIHEGMIAMRYYKAVPSLEKMITWSPDKTSGYLPPVSETVLTMLVEFGADTQVLRLVGALKGISETYAERYRSYLETKRHDDKRAKWIMEAPSAFVVAVARSAGRSGGDLELDELAKFLETTSGSFDILDSGMAEIAKVLTTRDPNRHADVLLNIIRKLRGEELICVCANLREHGSVELCENASWICRIELDDAKEEEVVKEWARAEFNLGNDAIIADTKKAMAKKLGHEWFGVRRLGAIGLAGLGDPRWFEIIEEIERDDNSYDFMQLFARIDSELAVVAWSYALEMPDNRQRRFAAELICRYANNIGVRLLAKMLGDKSSVVRNSVINCLHQNGRQEIKPYLDSLIRSDNWIVSETSMQLARIME